MLIGKRYSEDKLYRGIKHYDESPLLSEDLHEISDTLYKKNDYIMSSLYGSGLINSPEVVYTSTGARLSEPAVVLLEGDTILVQTPESIDLLSTVDVETSGYRGPDMYLCIVGWYQHVDYTDGTSLRSYGGVRNTELPNTIIDADLGFENTTRYQFRWDTVIVDKSVFTGTATIKSIKIGARDAKGGLLGDSKYLRTTKISNNLRKASSSYVDSRGGEYSYDFDYMSSDI